jgi:hypothetical protein
VRIQSADRRDGVRAAHARELQVHQHDVGMVALEQFDRFLAAGCGADHLHVRLPADLARHALADERMVVDAEDTDR